MTTSINIKDQKFYSEFISKSQEMFQNLLDNKSIILAHEIDNNKEYIIESREKIGGTYHADHLPLLMKNLREELIFNKHQETNFEITKYDKVLKTWLNMLFEMKPDYQQLHHILDIAFKNIGLEEIISGLPNNKNDAQLLLFLLEMAHVNRRKQNRNSHLHDEISNILTIALDGISDFEIKIERMNEAFIKYLDNSKILLESYDSSKSADILERIKNNFPSEAWGLYLEKFPNLPQKETYVKPILTEKSQYTLILEISPKILLNAYSSIHTYRDLEYIIKQIVNENMNKNLPRNVSSIAYNCTYDYVTHTIQTLEFTIISKTKEKPDSDLFQHIFFTLCEHYNEAKLNGDNELLRNNDFWKSLTMHTNLEYKVNSVENAQLKRKQEKIKL